MNEQLRAWGELAPDLSRHELSEEIEIAQSQGADLLHSVYAGALVRALADCTQCLGACRLWFMEDSEAPPDVCPHFNFFVAQNRQES